MKNVQPAKIHKMNVFCLVIYPAKNVTIHQPVQNVNQSPINYKMVNAVTINA